MTMPGGLPSPRPDQGFAPSGSPMAPGSQNPIVRAKQVIVFGPSGQVVGIFVYAVGTSPGPGNPPVDSVTRSGADPFGNATQSDFVAYGPGGAFVQMTDGQINFRGTAVQSAPAVIQTLDLAGFLDFNSGLVNGGDVAAEVTLQSRVASASSTSEFIVNADLSTFSGSMEISGENLNLGDGVNAKVILSPPMATPPNYPLSGASTIAQIAAFCNALKDSLHNRGMMT